MTIVANTSKLTTLDSVKLELGIDPGDTSQDIFIDGTILQMSSVIETYLDRTLGTAEYDQSKNLQSRRAVPDNVFMVKYPTSQVASVSYVLSDGATTVTLPADEYFFESDEGILSFTASGKQLMQNGIDGSSVFITLVVKHTGGYDLPGAADTGVMSLPEMIERACIDMVKNVYYVRTQNPTVKSEMVPDVLQQTYFQQSGGTTGGGSRSFVNGILSSLSSYLDLRQTF